MRTIILMAAFSLGCVFLLPRPARSLDDCVSCDCKHMKAWVVVSRQDLVYGMRMIDPMNDKQTIAIETVYAPASPGRILSTVADEGTITSQGETYNIYRYTDTFNLDCKLAVNESQKSVVRVTPNNEDAWTNFESTQMASVRYLCVKSQPLP